MPRQAGSVRWVAEQLRELGVELSHMTVQNNPDRILYDDEGNVVGYQHELPLQRRPGAPGPHKYPEKRDNT